MKSPDRDAADEITITERDTMQYAIDYFYDWMLMEGKRADEAESELATLRRRVAEMEERALSAEAAISAMREELLFIWKLDMPSDRNVYIQHVQAAAHRAIKASRLSPPTRKE